MLNTPLRFGMKPPTDPSQEPECCKKRKMGIPVGCCPPLPPDQLVKSTDNVIPLNVLNNAPCPEPVKKRNFLVQTMLNVVNWVKEFVSNLWKDLKQVFTGNKSEPAA